MPSARLRLSRQCQRNSGRRQHGMTNTSRFWTSVSVTACSAFRPAKRRCAARRCYRPGRWQLDGLIRHHAWCRSRHGLDWSFGTGMPPTQNTSTAAAKIDALNGCGPHAPFRRASRGRASGLILEHARRPRASCPRMRSAAAKSRAWRAAWRAAISASICSSSERRARLAAVAASLPSGNAGGQPEPLLRRQAAAARADWPAGAARPASAPRRLRRAGGARRH